MRSRCLPLLLLVACSADGLPESTDDAVLTYARIVDANYTDTLAEAEALDAALEGLVADPGETALDEARTAWLESREPYLQTEVFRFYDGPIDDAQDGPEGLLNAWPLDENYVDYVVGDDAAGIINDVSVTLDASTLESLNESGGEANIATGYHAIEFLLWGQDLSDDGPGERPHTDYVTDGTGTADNQDRRGEYLLLAGDLLVDHLGSVQEQWVDGGEYRSSFEADAEGSLEKVLTGMIILSGFETGGERLQAALDSGDEEDEHSGFSDNTHRDMIQDIQGVLNVWEGSYTAVDGTVVDGTGISAVVAELDPELQEELDTRIRTSLDLANALQPPFDQEIAPGSEGNQRVQDLIDSLRDQEELLFVVFDELGLSVTIPD